MLRRMPKLLTYSLIVLLIAVFTVILALYGIAWYKNHTTTQPLPIQINTDY